MEPTDETAIISDNPPTAREKFEQARLSRRAALRKMGLTTGMALFGMFAVDDLARIAIKKMEQHKETQQVAETVAKEFKNTGVVFAAAPGHTSACLSCVYAKTDCLTTADNNESTCLSAAGDPSSTQACKDAHARDEQACRDAYAECCNDNECHC